MCVSSMLPTTTPLPTSCGCAAEGPARSLRARESLRAAAVAHDRARVRGRDGDDTLDLHQALVDGRWSLVDTFEIDGKRYLIARHNTAAPASAPELSVRETQVAVFAAMGHALKRIAYELGVSESCVATYLRRALVKLRLPDRIALTRRLAGFRQPRVTAAAQAGRPPSTSADTSRSGAASS